MSRKGDCWDNSVVESFFATLKKALIHRRPWPTVKAARLAIVEYIEVFYIGDGHASFDLVGINDFNAGRRRPDHRADLPLALKGRDSQKETILLAHQPRAVGEAAELGIGLQLSGHTHGGQMWPWHYFVYLQQPYLSGLHRLKETQIYVSEGTGFWGPPMRLASRAEITEITLLSGKRAKAA